MEEQKLKSGVNKLYFILTKNIYIKSCIKNIKISQSGTPPSLWGKASPVPVERRPGERAAPGPSPSPS